MKVVIFPRFGENAHARERTQTNWFPGGIEAACLRSGRHARIVRGRAGAARHRIFHRSDYPYAAGSVRHAVHPDIRGGDARARMVAVLVVMAGGGLVGGSVL